jgi:hypothetical protein
MFKVSDFIPDLNVDVAVGQRGGQETPLRHHPQYRIENRSSPTKTGDA